MKGEIGLSSIHSDFFQNESQFTEVGVTDLLQVRDFAVSPIDVVLFWENTDIH